MGEATNEIKSLDDYNRAKVERRAAPFTPSSHEDVSDEGQEATQIRSGIEKTRSDLSDTIDALQDRLDPSKIAEQVKDQIREKATEAYDTAKTAVREATIGRAEKIMSSVSDAVSSVGETVTDMTGRAGTAMSETSSSVAEYIRENPVPFALVGIGLGMLAMNKRRTEKSSYGPSSYVAPNTYGSSGQSSLADKARDMASGVADTARSAADRTTTAVSSAASSVRDAAESAADSTRRQFHDVRNQAQQGARYATSQLKTTMKDNPLALGLAALAAGAVVGLSLPSTRLEGEYMGEARDRFIGQAKSVAQDAATKVQHVTEEAGRTFKDAAQKEGLLSS